MKKKAQAEPETRHGIKLYEHNPFVPDVKVKSRKITNERGDMMLVDAATGEINSPIAGFWECKEVDSSSFVKLFINGVKALAELSNAGTKVFEILYIELQRNTGKDKIYLRHKNLDKNEAIISERTFRRGLAELLDKKFIALTPTIGWYWVMSKYKLLTIGAIYSVLTVVLLTVIGLVFFNEKVSVREVIGLCLAVVSLILLTTKQ